MAKTIVLLFDIIEAKPRWRNGRRVGLKNLWGLKPHVGPTPTLGTKILVFSSIHFLMSANCQKPGNILCFPFINNSNIIRDAKRPFTLHSFS